MVWNGGDGCTTLQIHFKNTELYGMKKTPLVKADLKEGSRNMNSELHKQFQNTMINYQSTRRLSEFHTPLF
jgi:hypothetical protein